MASDGTIKITTELDNQKAQQAMSKFGRLVKAGIAGLGIAKVTSEIAQLGAYVIKTGIEFESAFAGVKKTVSATDEELQGFRDGIRGMAKDIPQTASEIASVAEAAGQLGIKNDYLLGFTRTMSDLGVATNMSSEQAATSLARLANITKMPQENFDRLGSVIVDLGNNLATTESEITEMGLRLAGAGEQVGLSEAQILGLAGALSSVGIEADAGGSAISTVMSKMQLAVERGGESLNQFAEVAGMSAEQFRQAFRDDAAGAIVSFVTGLGTMESRGQSAIATLADMEITEIRQRDALLRLSGAGDVLSESLGIATRAWDQNNALTNEAEQRYQTLESRLQILKNNVDDFGISIYDSLRDPLANTVNASIGYMERLHGAFNDGGIKAAASELGGIFNDVMDDIAGTSDAAEGLVTPIKNIANAGGSLAKSVLPVLADGLKFTAENAETLIPIAVGATAGFKAFNAIGKTTATVTKATAAATKVMAAMEKKNALQLVATNGGLTVRQYLIGAYNKQIPVATAMTGLWTKAQTALNTAISTNPVGVAVAATAALIAVAKVAASATEKQTEEEKKHSKALKESAKAAEESAQKAKERKESYEELVQTQNQQAAGDVAQLDRLSELNNELNSIVDANGRVKTGEEERAAFIVSQLSSALGMEIAMTDNQITNYQELQGQIQSLIEQKRIDAVLTAQQAKYEEAVANQMQVAVEASKNLTAMKKAENDVTTEQAELDELTNQKRQAVVDGNKRLVRSLDDKIKKQKEDVESAEKALNDSTKAYEANTESLKQYASDIDLYTSVAEAAATGNAEAIEAAIARITAGIKTASSATSEELQKQVIEVANTEAYIRQEVENGTPGFTEAMLNQARGATTAALEEFAKAAPGSAEELAKVPPEAVAALIAGNMKGQLSAEAQGAVDGILEQFAKLDPETQEAFANAVYGALEGLEEFDQIVNPAEEGVEAFLESLKVALDEHSPSKKTEEIFRLAMEGAANGVENGQGGVLSKAGEFVNSFLGKFMESDLGGRLQSAGASFMSLFGIGVSSQVGNSASAGRANADAANAGAGSVNPSGTGGLFGGLFGGGIAAMNGSLYGKGRGLSDNAKSGAGSVNPMGTGGVFGSLYADGVGGKIGEAKGKGKSLGDNAKTGAGSADGYQPGSDFGSGFVSGIGSWLGRAANKAAELAMSAYNALRNALDEHSPSRKTKASGKNFDLGLSVGIEKNMDAPVKAAKEMATRTLKALDSAELEKKIKALDASDVMARVTMAIDTKQAAASDKIVRSAELKERMRQAIEIKNDAPFLSEAELQKLSKMFAETATPLLIGALKESGLSLELYGEKVGGLIYQTVDQKMAGSAIRAGRHT